MDKAQAINYFWNSFGLPAYDESTVPPNAAMPRITYSVVTDMLDNVVSMTASIWYRSNSWKEITLKAEEIEQRLGEHGGQVIDLKVGKLWINRGTPFIQRMSDTDDSIRRIYINIQAEFLTPY
jgi:hypothetical protein